MILGIVMLWLAWQAQSPEAVQHVETARHAEAEKRFELAVAEYRKVTDLEPNSAPAFVSLGQALIEEHDFGGAIRPLKRALELDPNSASAHQLLGYALPPQVYPTKAIPHLETPHEQAARETGQAKPEQSADAIANLQEALQRGP